MVDKGSDRIIARLMSYSGQEQESTPDITENYEASCRAWMRQWILVEIRLSSWAYVDIVKGLLASWANTD